MSLPKNVEYQMNVQDCLACPFYRRDPSWRERVVGLLHELWTGHEIYRGKQGVWTDPTRGDSQ